jgi:lipoate-protein ligase B
MRLLVKRLGLLPYADALAIQRRAADDRIAGRASEDVLFLVEHPPVITMGRSSKDAHLLADRSALDSRGVELFEVERGGDVTFHGPGQLVGYPVIDLRNHREDLHWYLRQLEQVIIDAVARFGIPATRREKLTGVWTEGRKLASIGVHARQWVTWHGFALNVTTNLSWFDLIVPCGIQSVQMTSVEQEMMRRSNGTCLAVSPALMDEVMDAVVDATATAFGLEPCEPENPAARSP